MVYQVIGLMSGSSLDGLDIAFVQLHATGGKWGMELLESETYTYNAEWTEKLRGATRLSAEDYLILHTAYGEYIGQEVNRFIGAHGLEHKVHMIASHGHTSFHRPDKKMTAQLGDGAAIAAATGLPVISDLRAMDIAFGGQGAPIVPMGERLLFADYPFLLNLGGIANLSFHTAEKTLAFDSCVANRVLNMLINEVGQNFDNGGAMAASGSYNAALAEKLAMLDYYGDPYPKSLGNQWGTDTVYPLVKSAGLPLPDALHTYTIHIADQLAADLMKIAAKEGVELAGQRMLVTGGGAFNDFLIAALRTRLSALGMELEIPAPNIIAFKEAIIMALLGVLRWREENSVLSAATGARRNSIGGALWLGNDG